MRGSLKIYNAVELTIAKKPVIEQSSKLESSTRWSKCHKKKLRREERLVIQGNHIFMIGHQKNN